MSGVIYKIVTGNEVYVGSTFDYKIRYITHKSAINCVTNTNYNSKLYKTIRDNGGDWEMSIYEQNLSMTKEELRIYEEEVRVLLGATLNCRRAYRSYEQRQQQLREKNIRNRVVYDDRKKVSIKCECGCVVRRCCMAKHRRTPKHARLMISPELA